MTTHRAFIDEPPAVISDAELYLRRHELRALLSGTDRLATGQDVGLTSLSGRSPIAILFRQVATPNFELICFAHKARSLGLVPVVLEHRSDRFCVHNSYKRSLLTLPVVTGANRRREPILRRRNLIEHNAAEGRPFLSLTTAWGESLIDFHHRQLRDVLGPEAPHYVDLGEMLGSSTGTPSEYYEVLFGLLQGRFFLFEDFVVDEQTYRFFVRVVRPAFQEAVRITGRRPQITRLVPRHRAALNIWNSYPRAMSLGIRPS